MNHRPWRLVLVEADGREREARVPYVTRKNAQQAGRRNTRGRPGRSYRTFRALA